MVINSTFGDNFNIQNNVKLFFQNISSNNIIENRVYKYIFKLYIFIYMFLMTQLLETFIFMITISHYWNRYWYP